MFFYPRAIKNTIHIPFGHCFILGKDVFVYGSSAINPYPNKEG